MPDLNHKPFTFDLPGRRPAVWLACVLSLGFLIFVLANTAPWWAMAPAGLAAAMSLAALALNPRHGTRISTAGWLFYAPFHRRLIPLAQIDHVTFTPETDGPDSVTLHLTDGTTYQPATLCLPTAEVLRRELARARIRVL